MAHDSGRLHPIRDTEQLAALGSPVRQEVLDVAALAGPVSVTDVAAHLGREAASLYYHVRKLEAVGLLLPAGVRETDGRPERLYDAPARRLVVQPDPRSRRHRELVVGGALATLRLAEREIEDSLTRPAARARGMPRNNGTARFRGWLTAAQRRELSAHLGAVAELFARAEPGPRRRLTSLTFALASPAPPMQSEG